MIDKSCKEFTQMLASAAPVPGGGGASALAGALGTALGSMVANLTLGKQKYQDVQDEIKVILDKAEKLQKELLDLVQADAEAFEPLSKAYGLPKETKEQMKYRDEVMAQALIKACSVPVIIMEKSLEAIKLHEELSRIGSRMVISDVGVGVLLCKSSLLGAALNVFINTKLMKNREYAEEINRQTEKMIEEGTILADKVYEDVVKEIR